jgi:hypothetical protein
MGRTDLPRHATSGPAAGRTRMRKRYPLAILLVLLVAMVLAAALATTAFALPTFTAGSGATPACVTCHTQSQVHGVGAHQTFFASCINCHLTGSTGTPPTPGACGACHQGVNHIVLEPTHSTLSCTTCHAVPVSIASITPPHATVGTSVTLTGTGFGVAQGTGTVKFGTTAATVTSWNETSLAVTVPASLSPGAVNVTVTRTDGTASNAFAFTVDAPPAPTITSFKPASGPVGTTVTLTGTGFSGVSAVTFNGVVATTFAAPNDTTITAKVPTGATTGTIQVTTPGGSVNSATVFTVTVVTPAKITLKITGLVAGVTKLGKTVTAKGAVTPLSVGQKVTLLIQKKNALGKFVKFTTKSGLVKALGNYGIAWRTSKRGVFRMQTSIAAMATHTKATSVMSKPFRVK